MAMWDITYVIGDMILICIHQIKKIIWQFFSRRIH